MWKRTGSAFFTYCVLEACLNQSSGLERVSAPPCVAMQHLIIVMVLLKRDGRFICKDK